MAQVQAKGMKWSLEAAQNAASRHEYIKVGPNAGTLHLTGAKNRWKKPENQGDVYVPTLRVVGTPAAISQLFVQQLGYQAGEIQQHLAGAYTAQNVDGALRGQFDAESSAYKTYKSGVTAQKKAQGPGISLADLPYLVQELDNATKAARAAKQVGSPRSPGARAGRTRPLLQRLQDARAKGKLLDVSNMKPNGTDIKMIPATLGPASKKVGVPGLEIVSSNPANYAAAVAMLGAGYEGFTARYNQQVNQPKSLGGAGAVGVAPGLGALGVPQVQPQGVVTPTFRAATPPPLGLPLGQGLGGLPTVNAGFPAQLPPVAQSVGTPRSPSGRRL